MQKIDRSEMPPEYHYYRSHSRAYFDYTVRSERGKVVQVEEDGEYAYIHHYIFGLFSVAYFEKCDIEPTRELLAKYGMKRGIVFWSGWKRESPFFVIAKDSPVSVMSTKGDILPSIEHDISLGSIWQRLDAWKKKKWWFHLGYIFSHFYHHSTRSSFSVLDTAEYWKKWSSSARGHRNKIQNEIKAKILTIDTETSLEEFLSLYTKTKVHHRWKEYNIWRQKYLSKYHNANIRIYTASIYWEILAGAIFLDDNPTSTYLIAFQDDRAKSHHLWLALLDRWFWESEKLWYKYLDLDHMRDTLDPLSYTGYTKFKSEIADYDVFFRDLWMKIFV